jgi:phage FluMu gp28-like protein
VLKDEDKDILTYRIKFASGFRITALSSRPNNLRGKKGFVVIDEAAFHDDLDGLIKAAMALTMWSDTTQIMIISTHKGVDNKFNELLADCRAGKLPYSVHRITLEDALAEGLFKRICNVNGKDWTKEAEAEWEAALRKRYAHNAAEELDCVPNQSGGAYLSRAVIESRMVDTAPVVRYTCKPGFDELPVHVRELDTQDWIDFTLKPLCEALPPTARSALGVDFGRSGDLSVEIPLLEGQALKRDIPFILEMRNVPFEQQRQITFWLCDHLPRFTHGAFDARGNGQYLAEVAMQRYGSSSITQVMLSNPWYLENMPRLKAALEDGTINSMPKDKDILDDLRTITVEKGIPKIGEPRSKGADGGQRHGDAAVALALGWFATNQGGGAMNYIDVPRSTRNAPASTNFNRPNHAGDRPAGDSRRDY